jgi:hypothetical protein
MKQRTRKPVRQPSSPTAGLLLALLVAGCQAGPTRAPSPPDQPLPTTASSGAAAGFYLDALDGMAPGDGARQQATLLAARGTWQQTPSPSNTLRYALVLGTPGHADTNPLQASRLLAGLLAAPAILSADELRLAAAFQREFTARVSLYAELARTREDADARLRAAEAETQTRLNALSADVARLRRERDAVQEKLDAIADIEKSLMERDGETAPSPDATPP